MSDEGSRVEKLVGLLGSSHDGERAAAGLLLHRAARERKLTLVEYLKAALIKTEARAEPHADPHWWDGGSLLDQLAQAARFKNILTRWEADFARTVLRQYGFDQELSPKQRATARTIVTKARRAATAGARPG